ncbi:hypothetical protein BH24ACT2_BH24ACT2_04720 [soil metagenome]
MNEQGGGIDVDEVVRTVEDCPSVVRLVPGSSVEVATYLPGRRVPGVRVHDGVLEVHVAARYGQPLPEVADEVRRALAEVVGRHPVAVFIDDLDLEDDPEFESAEEAGLPG